MNASISSQFLEGRYSTEVTQYYHISLGLYTELQYNMQHKLRIKS